jgi:hypothetical protein
MNTAFTQEHNAVNFSANNWFWYYFTCDIPRAAWVTPAS